MLSLFTDGELLAARLVPMGDEVTFARFPEQVAVPRFGKVAHRDEQAVMPLQYLQHVFFHHLARSLTDQNDGIRIGQQPYRPASVGEVVQDGAGIIEALGNHQPGPGEAASINLIGLFEFQFLLNRVE